MWLSKDVIESTEAHVRVVYVDMALVAFWNQKREAGEPRLFTGFYWLNGAAEAGPFRSRSAAYRDAWYHQVVKREPPSINTQLPRKRRV